MQAVTRTRLFCSSLAFRWISAACLALGLSSAAQAEIVVQDDAGQEIRLKAPVQRIVSLAPHVTENLFAAGAGSRVVGVVEYSDFPEAAKKLPLVGGYSRLNLEAIIGLKPELVIAFQSGNPPAELDQLRKLGIKIYLSQPRDIESIASELERFGQLAGTSTQANSVARNIRQRLQTLRQRYSHLPKVPTFYQVWKNPLVTIGGPQIISGVIGLCGGENVFQHLTPLAPKVSVEAVIAAMPEAIVASGMGEDRPEWLNDWKRYSQIPAIKRDNLFFIPSSLVQRHTPRLLDGAEMMCKHLETARARRK